MENRAKDYLVVNANMPFYLFNQTKKLQNRVTLHWDITLDGPAEQPMKPYISMDPLIDCDLNKTKLEKKIPN